uniref:DNA excision repair protein ERCC-8 n=1 Tax=Parascaris univalens TaxID=6257 RepID=A0A915BTD2_PARUN
AQTFSANASLHDIIACECRADTRCCQNVEGSSFSPRCFLRSQLGTRTRADDIFSNFKRKVIEKRVKHLRISWRHRVPFMPSNASGIFCMDIDPAEQRYLLCGSCNGVMSIVDLEMPLSKDSARPLEHTIVSSTHRHGHKFLVTGCQWFPQDTSTFLSSSMDKTMKLWDTNKMKVVDQYAFREEVLQFHWSGVPSRRSLIAVANMTSNIELIDPRAGDAIQNLRWKTEYVSSVRWSPEQENFLLTGGKHGNVVLWDVRSAKSHLKTLCAPLENAHPACVGGIRFSDDGLHVVSMSIDRVLRIWRAHTMELVNTIKIQLPKEGIDTTLKNPSIHFDILSVDGVLRACIPLGDEILMLNLEETRNAYRSLLVGHFHFVNACVYRKDRHQVISSSNDRMILVWSPAMDEVLPDGLSDVVHRLQLDDWSDDD